MEVSPLENAIEVMENKNLQLRTLIAQCQARQGQSVSPLTMCLNGVIDAAVNGGLARYQEVRASGTQEYLFVIQSSVPEYFSRTCNHSHGSFTVLLFGAKMLASYPLIPS